MKGFFVLVWIYLIFASIQSWANKYSQIKRRKLRKDKRIKERKIYSKPWAETKKEFADENKKGASPTGDAGKTNEKDFVVEGKYQLKWLLSYNEKAAYRDLKKACDQNGLFLMAKVRLFDLVEPRKGVPVVYTNKIRAKHVDFVICDEKLVARCIVELDDSSHRSVDRKERDEFVDAVLESVGYKVIHTEGITDKVIASILEISKR